MMAAVYATAFGAIQQMPRVVPGLEQVRTLDTTAQEQTISGVQSFQEMGGLAGRVALAYLAAVIISRRKLLHVFQFPGIVLLPVVFLLVPSVGLPLAQWGIFLVGLTTIAQMSFWGNYLPRVYPTHLRGTGESFAANVGGRMIGTFGAFVTVQLVTSMPGGTVPIRLAYACAIVGTHRLRRSTSRRASGCRNRSRRTFRIKPSCDSRTNAMRDQPPPAGSFSGRLQARPSRWQPASPGDRGSTDHTGDAGDPACAAPPCRMSC